MARGINKDYSSLTVDELNNPLVFVVDMNQGFARKGALADPAIEEVAGPIEDVLKRANPEGIFVCDTHELNCREFDFFPDHCVRGSEEAEVLEVLQPYIHKTVEKNSINAFFSKDFQELLKDLKDRDLIVTGCCTDLCVLQLALSLQSWICENDINSRVIVPIDCVDTYDIEDIHPADEWNNFALENMKNNGIVVIDSLK